MHGAGEPIEVKGTVKRADQTPIQDATVTVISIANNVTRRQIRTDKSGSYRFVLSPLNRYVIYVVKEGFTLKAMAAPDDGKEANIIMGAVSQR